MFERERDLALARLGGAPHAQAPRLGAEVKEREATVRQLRYSLHVEGREASQAAKLLAESQLAGWLDDTGSMSAGQTGSQDPLTLGAPQMSAWEAPGTCHPWGLPFQLEGKMSFNDSGRWIAQALDVFYQLLPSQHLEVYPKLLLFLCLLRPEQHK